MAFASLHKKVPSKQERPRESPERPAFATVVPLRKRDVAWRYIQPVYEGAKETLLVPLRPHFFKLAEDRARLNDSAVFLPPRPGEHRFTQRLGDPELIRVISDKEVRVIRALADKEYRQLIDEPGILFASLSPRSAIARQLTGAKCSLGVFTAACGTPLGATQATIIVFSSELGEVLRRGKLATNEFGKKVFTEIKTNYEYADRGRDFIDDVMHSRAAAKDPVSVPTEMEPVLWEAIVTEDFSGIGPLWFGRTLNHELQHAKDRTLFESIGWGLERRNLVRHLNALLGISKVMSAGASADRLSAYESLVFAYPVSEHRNKNNAPFELKDYANELLSLAGVSSADGLTSWGTGYTVRDALYPTAKRYREFVKEPTREKFEQYAKTAMIIHAALLRMNENLDGLAKTVSASRKKVQGNDVDFPANVVAHSRDYLKSLLRVSFIEYEFDAVSELKAYGTVNATVIPHGGTYSTIAHLPSRMIAEIALRSPKNRVEIHKKLETVIRMDEIYRIIKDSYPDVYEKYSPK